MAKHNDQPIKDVLQEMVDTLKLKNKLHETKIRKFWEEVMGTTINQYTKDIKLVRKKVFITLDSASLRQELSFSRDKLKKVLNEDLGEEYIQEVIIR